MLKNLSFKKKKKYFRI